MKPAKVLAALHEIAQIRTIRDAQLEASRSITRHAASETERHRAAVKDANSSLQDQVDFVRQTVTGNTRFSIGALQNAVLATRHYRTCAIDAENQLAKAKEAERNARMQMSHSQSLLDLTDSLINAGSRDLRRARDKHQDLLLESFSMSKAKNEDS